LWVHDFIVWTRFLDLNHVSCGSREVVEQHDGPPNFHESLTNLSYLAGITRGTEMQLGVAVLCMPYRNPIVTARQIANIDVLSRGRMILGIGVGAPKNRNNHDFEVLGIPRSDKYKRTNEYLRTMLEIWKEGPSEFSGEYNSFEPEEFYPKPVQKPHPPIWFGGSSEKAMGMVIEFGSGWLPGVTNPDGYRQRIEKLGEMAAAQGKPDFKVTNGLEITTCVALTREEAENRANRTLTSRTEGYPLSIDQVYDFSLLGSVDDVRKRCLEYVEAGVRHFEIKPIYHNLEQLHEQIELIGKEIAPAVREAVS
jgi:alkanesulfonate monooxygenase SsuD/methylene tetrahydromethanopterin reductase-like flavin-dependent oxidoreductase (luciferase family)